MEQLGKIASSIADIGTTTELLQLGFVQNALIAVALLGLVAGLVGPFVVMRSMGFSVHGTSELSLTGASAALLFGLNVGAGALLGSVVAAVLFALFGARASDRDSSIGVVMAFGLGLSVLFIHLYPGRAGSSFSLLTGQIVGVSGAGIAQLAIVAVIVVAVLGFIYRPLVFASADAEVAATRGIHVRVLNMVFAVLLGLVAAQAVQIVGALLVLSLLITPAAAAAAVVRSPGAAIALSVVFAEIAAVGGLLLSLAPGVPISVFVTTISFAIYVICRTASAVKNKG
ncbi:metal ABC transporter permease [Dietzia sp.]|uniref:metal ABC transporter permease n=1 Tax=Dietzia sp. TaxID=1871616 RepID=UPI002FDA4BB5